jgi:hypothetical protein
MKTTLCILLLAAVLSTACSRSSARSTTDSSFEAPSASGDLVRSPAAPRMLFFCYQHDHLLQQAPGDDDTAFAQALQQGAHGNNIAHLIARRRQQLRAANASTQQEADLHTLYEYQQTFQNDIQRYGMQAAEWCSNQSTSAAQIGCTNARRFQQGSETRLRIVNEYLGQRGGRVVQSDSGAGQADREGMQHVEKEYRQKMKQINDEERAWEREKRQMDAATRGNPYQ